MFYFMVIKWFIDKNIKLQPKMAELHDVADIYKDTLQTKVTGQLSKRLKI